MAAVTTSAALPSDVTSPGDYQTWHLHRDEDISAPGGWLKWYELGPDSRDRSLLRNRCREALAELIATEQIRVAGRVGFVTLLALPKVPLLTISVWQHEDELWQSRWELPSAEPPLWRKMGHPTHRAHRMADVRELLPISFERDAWVRFLRSHRTVDDLARYRSATLEGAG